MKPTIVVDLDNVLSRSAEGFVAFSNKHFGTDMTLEDYSEDWVSMWGVSYEEAERRGEVMRENHMHRGYEPVQGAFEALQKLEPNYRLIILTSRRAVVEPDTRAWLEQYFPGIFTGVLFSGIWENPKEHDGHLMTKGEQYKQMGVQYVIDDHLKHCVSAFQNGVPAVLFGNYPWNRVDRLPSGVVRCGDWQMVLDYFQKELNR